VGVIGFEDVEVCLGGGQLGGFGFFLLWKALLRLALMQIGSVVFF
jgi:hypothetical protein